MKPKTGTETASHFRYKCEGLRRFLFVPDTASMGFLKAYEKNGNCVYGVLLNLHQIGDHFHVA